MSDERPIGGGMGSKAFAGGPEAADDFRKLTIDQLLTNANWKARKEGYDKIAKEPKKYRTTFFDKIARISTESNAAAQESLFDALLVLVPVCDSDELDLVCQAPLSLVIEKGITGRPKAVSSGQDVVSSLVESGKQNEVFDSLLPAFTHKTPKNRMAATQMCTKLVSDFGVQHFPLKGILKAMQPLFNDVNPQVRKEALALCCQCYKYIGAAIKGFLSDLRDVQLQELERQFESVMLGGTPPKAIRGASSGGANGKTSSSDKQPVAIGSLLGGGSGDTDDAAFELMDQSLVIPKLPKKFFPTALDKNTPWQDRCEYVTNTLMPLLAAPRFRASDDYHELASMMKIYLVDPQAPLMLLGFQMIQECARGLRASFANCAKIYIGPLFEKMKDKKTSVLQHITVTLEKLIQYHCIIMDQCVDEMEQVSQGKNPSQRIAVIHFCTRMVSQLDSSQYQRLGRSVNMLKRMANDEKSENRDAAYVLLSKLSSAFGEGQLQAVFASMDEKQKARMQIVVASSEAAGGAGSSSLPTPKSAIATPSSSPAKKYPRVEDLAASRSSTAELSASHTATARRVASAHGSRSGTVGTSASDSTGGSTRPSTVGMGRPTGHGVPGRAGASVAPSLDDPISLESLLPPRMEAGNLMLGLLNGDTTVLDLLRSHEWSQRLDGMLRVRSATEQWTAAESTKYLSALTVYLRMHPGFKESTFQVFHAVLNVLSDTMSKATSLPPGAGYAIVAGGTPRLTDMKNRQPVRDICSRVGQRLGFRFVIHHMMLVAKEVRTPKLMQECNEYFKEIVDRCARAGDAPTSGDGLDSREMVDYLRRPCFEQTSQPLRSASMQLLVALSRYDTATVQAMLPSLPAQVAVQFEQQSSTILSGRESVDDRGSDGAGATRAPRPTLPRPRPSAAGSALAQQSPPSSSVAAPSAGDGDVPQKRHRGASQSPGLSTRAGRASVGPGGVPVSPSVPSRRVRSSSGRPSSSNAHAAGPTATGQSASSGVMRTPGSQPLETATPRAPEMPPALRLLVREITAGVDWRGRLEAVHRVEEYIDNNNGLLPPGAAAPLLLALGSRFEESNKNFVVDVLRAVQRTVVAGGHEESRSAMRRLMPGALAMLGDQKTMLREEARKVVFLGMDVCGLDMLLQALQRPLGSDSNIARQNTLEAMVYGFENLGPDAASVSRAGLQLLIPPIVRGLMDRIQEVRLAAEHAVGYVMAAVGDEPILRYVQQLRPADQQAVRPAIERQLELHTPATAGNPLDTNEDVANEDEEAALHTEPCDGRMSPVQPRTPRTSTSASPVTTPRRNGPAAGGGGSSAWPPRKASTAGGVSTPNHRGSLTPRTAGAAAVASSSGSAAPGAPASPASQAAATSRSTRRPSLNVTTVVPSGDPHAGPPGGAASPSTAGLTTPTAGKTASGATTRRHPVEKDHAAPYKANEGMYSTPEILVGLRSATPSVAYNMCTDFMKHLRAGDDCGTPEMMQVMIERLYDNTHKLEPDLTLGLIGCLSAMFTTPRSAQRCHSSLLFRMVGTMFDCLLSEQFSLHENVLKSLNSMTLRLLEGCPPNDVFSALISRMTSYSTTYLQSGRKSDLKYIQVTVKCVMRLDLELVAPDSVILCCHEYLLQHPPSSFRSLDDLPIRTVKTILQTVTRRYGVELLASADRLVGPQNLVTHFIRACLENRDKAARNQRESNEKHAAEESIRQQRASQSPAPHAGPTPPRVTDGSTTPMRATANAIRVGSPKRTVHVDPAEGTASPSARAPTPKAASMSAGANACSLPPQAAPAVAPEKRRASVAAGPPVPTPTPKTPTSSAAAAGAAMGSASAAPSSSGATPEELSMATIFSHIRHHTTSQQGIDELYAYLQAGHANCNEDFSHQFLRCSEAFRVYIKRKLDRKVAEDSNVLKSFVLPEALQRLA